MASNAHFIAPEKVPLPQFIIALLLVKSKPFATPIKGLDVQGSDPLTAFADLSTEYIASLRSCIRNGTRTQSADTPHNHIDTTSFWRQAYTKSEEEKIILRARIAELERRDNNRIIEESVIPTAANSQRKRKRAPIAASQSSNNKKQKKAQILTSTSEVECLDEVWISHTENPTLSPVNNIGKIYCIYGISRTEHIGDACVHYIYALQLSMSIRATSEEICSNLCLLAYSIRRLIRAASGPKTDLQSDMPVAKDIATIAERQDLQGPFSMHEILTTKLLAIPRSFSQILQASDILGRTTAEKPMQQVAIYNIVQVLQTLLRAICDTARTQTAALPVESAKNFCPTKSKAKQPPSSPSNNPPTHNDTPPKLCHILLSMVQCLKPPNPLHQAILDGFLFHFLTLIGETLKTAVFNDPSANPKISTEHPPNPDQDNPESEKRHVEAQAPYLLSLLEPILNLAAKFPDPDPPPNEDTTDRLTTNTVASRKVPSNLSHLARVRLQHTLLRAVFGREGAEDFGLALQPPGFPEHIAKMLKIRPGGEEDAGDARERFKRELWRLLGWDVLRGANFLFQFEGASGGA